MVNQQTTLAALIRKSLLRDTTLKNMLTTTTPGTDETPRPAALDIPVPDTPEAVEADPVGEEGNAYDPH